MNSSERISRLKVKLIHHIRIRSLDFTNLYYEILRERCLSAAGGTQQRSGNRVSRFDADEPWLERASAHARHRRRTPRVVGQPHVRK